MPELPEVETIKKDLEQKIVGAKITDVNFLWNGILKNENIENFKKSVIGLTISGVNRRAKNLNVRLNGGLNLLFHMKMTGHLIVTDSHWQVDKNGRWLPHESEKSPLTEPLNQYIRVIFSLDNGKIVAFSDLRKFGYVKLVSDAELQKIYKEYGPEPFSEEFNVDYLEKILVSKNMPIKKVLMDQKLVAGIGNIYADEILHESKIHPLKKASDLTKTDIKKIFESTRRILKEAVKLRGTSVSDFRDTNGEKGSFGNNLKVYRRVGLPCECGGKVERITLGGRGTHFCSKCQKL
jgi:formamidopyrimidine-DNA glycosylase